MQGFPECFGNLQHLVIVIYDKKNNNGTFSEHFLGTRKNILSISVKFKVRNLKYYVYITKTKTWQMCKNHLQQQLPIHLSLHYYIVCKDACTDCVRLRQQLAHDAPLISPSPWGSTFSPALSPLPTPLIRDPSILPYMDDPLHDWQKLNTKVKQMFWFLTHDEPYVLSLIKNKAGTTTGAKTAFPDYS